MVRLSNPYYKRVPGSTCKYGFKKNTQLKKGTKFPLNIAVQYTTSTPFLPEYSILTPAFFQARERDPTASCDDLVPENGRLGSKPKIAS